MVVPVVQRDTALLLGVSCCVSSVVDEDQILIQTRGQRCGPIWTGEDVPLGWKVEAPPFQPIPSLLVLALACGRVVPLELSSSC